MSNVTKHSRCQFCLLCQKTSIFDVGISVSPGLGITTTAFHIHAQIFHFLNIIFDYFYSHAASILQLHIFIIHEIVLFFLNSVYLRHMSTSLHYSVISLNPLSELSFQ